MEILNIQSIVTVIGVVGLILSSLFWCFRKPIAFAKRGMPYTKLKIIEKVTVTHNTRKFRIALPTDDTVFGLPIGNHVQLRFVDSNNEPVIRPYTPISSRKDVGFFEIVVKIYPEGQMGQYLDNRSVGDMIDVKGPIGHLYYDLPSHITLRRPRKTVSLNFQSMNMIAGGTGLTPMYQLIQRVIADPRDVTRVKMIYGNSTEDDILCREDLEEMRRMDYVDIVFTIGSAKNSWKEETGHVTSEMIKKYMSPPQDEPVNLICGPPGMMRAMTKILKEMGHPKDRIISF